MRRIRAIGACLVAVAAGFLAGRYLAPARGTPEEHAGPAAPPAADGAETVWTCSMHPQIRLPQPGSCPICGMDLVPAAAGGSGDGTITLGEGARRIASIEVAPVARRRLVHEIRTVGRIDFSEPHVVHMTARIGGRVERLYADFTGVVVTKGDHLVDLYSPELILAQEELLLAAAHRNAVGSEAPGRITADAAYEAARQKLILWGITEGQIAHILSAGRAGTVLTLYAPQGGTVIEKRIREGMYVAVGDPLYTIADLSTVWLYADVYEYELPWVALGQPVAVEAEGVPGERFEGMLAFIDPVVNDATRTVRVRVNLPNPDGRLKPGMFATAVIRAALGPNGKRTPSHLAGKFACPMHPEVFSDGAGDCRICGMPLAKVPEEPVASAPRHVCPMNCQPAAMEPGRCAVCGMTLIPEEVRDNAALPEVLAVPATAVLDTGTRKVVYVEIEPGRYVMRPITTGPRAGDHYPVLSGVTEGDLVVVKGNFLLDSQSQIEGKPSLLFPEGLRRDAGEEAVPAGHAGH